MSITITADTVLAPGGLVSPGPNGATAPLLVGDLATYLGLNSNGSPSTLTFIDTNSSNSSIGTTVLSTASSTLTLTPPNYAANTFFAGPSSGSSAQPRARTLAGADAPTTWLTSTIAPKSTSPSAITLQNALSGADITMTLDATEAQFHCVNANSGIGINASGGGFITNGSGDGFAWDNDDLSITFGNNITLTAQQQLLRLTTNFVGSITLGSGHISIDNGSAGTTSILGSIINQGSVGGSLTLGLGNTRIVSGGSSSAVTIMSAATGSLGLFGATPHTRATISGNVTVNYTDVLNQLLIALGSASGYGLISNAAVT